MKDLIRDRSSTACIKSYMKFQEKEKELNKYFYNSKSAVHEALCGEGCNSAK